MAEETHQRHIRYSLVTMIILLALANVFHIVAWRERVGIRRVQTNRGEIHKMMLESANANRAMTSEEIQRAMELLK